MVLFMIFVLIKLEGFTKDVLLNIAGHGDGLISIILSRIHNPYFVIS